MLLPIKPAAPVTKTLCIGDLESTEIRNGECGKKNQSRLAREQEQRYANTREKAWT
jgi:hypothetical protein